MADVAAASPDQSSVPPGPIFAVDDRTRRTVKVILTCVYWLYMVSLVGPILGFVVSFVVSMTDGAYWGDPVDVVEAAIILGIVWLVIGWLARLFFNLVVLSIQSALFSAIARHLDRAMARLPLRFSLAGKWSLPAPGCVGLDPVRRILVLMCQDTGYHMLLLRPQHILLAKTEREQTLHTVTSYSGSWLGGFGNGLTGGFSFGRAKSTTAAQDNVFLEVQFRLHDHEAPRYVAIPCGAQRQWAESWVIAIGELRR